jgi:PAS domain S-box-containing protein
MFSNTTEKQVPTATEILSNLILIVDDDPDIVRSLSEALRFKGYETRTTTDSLEALRLFKEDGEFDVVITDLMMPDLGGTQLLEKIKQHDPNCEVIVLTGFGSSESAIEALKKGAHDYLKKPTNIDELFISVAKAIEKKRLTLQNLQYQMDLESLVEERSAELVKTQKFLHSVLESSTEYFIIATNEEGLITLFNRGAEILFGYDREEVEGKKSIFFIPGMDEGNGVHDLDRLIERGMVDQSHTIINRDNREISISLTVTPIRSIDDDTTGYIWIGKDISEQLAMQAQLEVYTHNLEKIVSERTRELQEQNQALEEALKRLKDAQIQLLQAEKMASLGQLSAGIAHEINNPIGFVNSNLTTLKRYVQTLRDFCHRLDALISSFSPEAVAEVTDLKKDKKIDFILDDIADVVDESLEGTQRVKSIVQDLKEFSYQGGEDLLPYDINKGLKSTLNIVWNELKNKADVVEDYGDLPPVVCYPQQINQVFMNLLVNAAQAIKKRGTIRLRTFKDGDDACIEISDTGEGIPPENVNRIFEPFFTTKEVGQGTGLGLSISYQIVSKHGGNLSVQSEPGKGTAFTIRLPLAGPEVKAKTSTSLQAETMKE